MKLHKKLIVFAFFIIALSQAIITVQFPTYTDDVLYLISSSRYFEEGGFSPPIFPDCYTQKKGIKVPTLILPGYIINSAYNYLIKSHLSLRILSILKFFLWLILIYFIRKKIKTHESKSSRLLFLNLALTSTLPIILTIARPEQNIILILCFLIILYLSNLKSNLILYLTSTITCLWLSFIHPKSFFFYPFILTIFLKKISSITFKTLTVITLFGILITAKDYNAKLFKCPGNTNIEREVNKVNMVTNLTEHIKRPVNLVQVGSLNITKQISGALHYIPGWENWSGVNNFLNNNYVFLKVIYSLLLMFIIFYPFKFITNILSKRTNAKTYSHKLISYLLMICFYAYCFFAGIHSLYYPQFTYSILFTIFILLAPDLEKNKSLRTVLVFTLIINTCFSAKNIVNPNTYKIHKSWEQFMNKNLVKFFSRSSDSNKENETIRNVAQQCGIKNPNNSKLIIDESTYFAMSKSKQPVMTQYTWKHFRNNSYTLDDLKKLKYNGIISRCSRLPKEVSENTKNYGRYCCKSFSD